MYRKREGHQYHLINPDIPCIFEASIKGQRLHIYGCQNKKELLHEKVRFRFGGPPFQSEFICINEILFRPFKNNSPMKFQPCKCTSSGLHKAHH